MRTIPGEDGLQHALRNPWVTECGSFIINGPVWEPEDKPVTCIECLTAEKEPPDEPPEGFEFL